LVVDFSEIKRVKIRSRLFRYKKQQKAGNSGASIL